MTPSQQELENRKDSRDEYPIVDSRWRYLQGLRLGLVTGFAIMMATYDGIYKVAWGALVIASVARPFV